MLSYQPGKPAAKVPEHKAEMADRLGMGFSAGRSGISHSAAIETIEQEGVRDKRRNGGGRRKNRYLDDSDSDDDDFVVVRQVGFVFVFIPVICYLGGSETGVASFFWCCDNFLQRRF